MNMQQKVRMLELLNEMQTILLEDINSSGAAPASTPLPPQDVAHQASMPTLQLKFSEVVQPHDDDPDHKFSLVVPSQNDAPLVDALSLACQGHDEAPLSGWSAEEAQATQQAALDAAFQREQKMWTPEVGHE